MRHLTYVVLTTIQPHRYWTAKRVHACQMSSDILENAQSVVLELNDDVTCPRCAQISQK